MPPSATSQVRASPERDALSFATVLLSVLSARRRAGSNSVNVFLGLGLPWLLQSLYWRAKGSPFNAPAGAVSFSVTVYMCCSLVCLCLLCYKRVYNGGELGGKGFSRTGIAAVLFALWVLYLALSGMQAMGRIEGF